MSPRRGRAGNRPEATADLAGVDPEPIWQWGLIERTSTGLLGLKVGLDGARGMLAVADAWANDSLP